MKWKQFKSAMGLEDVLVRVESIDGRRLELVLLAGSEDVRVPLKPAQARQIAANLLAGARRIDKDGHAELIESIERSKYAAQGIDADLAAEAFTLYPDDPDRMPPRKPDYR